MARFFLIQHKDMLFRLLRSSHRMCSIKKDVLKIFSKFIRQHLCCCLFLIKLQTWRPATLSKETPTQVFSCGYCKVFKNTYFEEHLRTAASVRKQRKNVFWHLAHEKQVRIAQIVRKTSLAFEIEYTSTNSNAA